ncbi:hypothetical protein RUM43_006534 [Polyplax serrata]|uniref:Uncharacterized protein n=1 Tax=Polyplax serrata TaxID=468196 RepID=A0AAN8NXX8_POLSC
MEKWYTLKIIRVKEEEQREERTKSETCNRIQETSVKPKLLTNPILGIQLPIIVVGTRHPVIKQEREGVGNFQKEEGIKRDRIEKNTNHAHLDDKTAVGGTGRCCQPQEMKHLLLAKDDREKTYLMTSPRRGIVVFGP